VHVPDQGTSVGGRRLAAELRRLRERAGLTGEEASQRLGWSGSKLSRIERHQIGVKQGDLRELLTLYEVDEGYRDELVALNSESDKKARLVRATGGFPQVAGYMSAEAEAESVWNWEPQVVPGLLQTWGYARALRQLWLGMFPGPQSETDRWADTRLMRQKVLTRDPPLNLSVVIDESALCRRFGDRSVMREQMQHLVASSELPNVEVRIYPLDSDDPPIGTGAFSYMQFLQVHEVPLDDIVSVELLEGTHELVDEEETFQYRVAFEYLVNGALDPARSRSLISATVDEFWA
jgi:transcriptional regulator with XRE-family HTH domain